MKFKAVVACCAFGLTPLTAAADAAFDAALSAMASKRAEIIAAAKTGDFSNLPAEFTPPPAVIAALRARADAGELDLSPGGLAGIAADLRAAGFDAPPPAAALAAKIALFKDNPPLPAGTADALRSRFKETVAAHFSAQGVDPSTLAAARVDIVTLRGDAAATVDPHGDGLIRFAAPLVRMPDGAAAIATRAGVAPIQAGAVQLSAAARDAIATQAVNIDGVAQAATAAIEGGRVVLRSALPLAVAHADMGDAETAMRFRAAEMVRIAEAVETTGCVSADCGSGPSDAVGRSVTQTAAAQTAARAPVPAQFAALDVEQLTKLRLSNRDAAMSDAELRAAGGDRSGLIASVLDALDRSGRSGPQGAAKPYATRTMLAGGALIYDPHRAGDAAVDAADLRLPVFGGLADW